MYRRNRGEPAEHPLVAAARAQGTPITQLDGHVRLLPEAVRWLCGKIQGEQFSILHCHDYKTNLVGAVAAWKIAQAAPLLVATVRHTESGPQMALFQALDSLVLHRFRYLTVPSQGATRELKRWPTLRRRLRVIHHSLADLPDLQQPSISPPLRSSGPVISIVGRLQPVKGHRIFLAAARMVLGVRPDARFWIIGDGELRSELEAMASQIGLGGAVCFLGYRKDALQLLRMSDVAVCASHYESFSRFLLEALALERPVVATAVGGIPEIVVDGKTGLLVPPRDPEALAAAVLRLLEDRELAQRLGAAGRGFVNQHYSAQSQASALAALYREAVACTS